MTRPGRILVLVSLASLAVGCFGDKRSPKPNGTALWIAAESSVPEAGVLGRLSSQGIGEYFVEAARLRVEGRTVAVEPAPALRMTRRERTTLVVGGAWPLLDVDVEATARGLAEAVAGLRLEADRAGQLPVGVHFDLETGGTSESFAAVLPELRDLMDPDLYLSVSLSRRDLELEGLSEMLGAVDFAVAFLYGQRPGEKEDSAAWDLLAVERAAGRLEEIGRPYYLAASILGFASWRGRGGETKAETTELDLASLVREDRLELKRGFTLEGIDRQVYEFRARGPVTVGSWKLAASDSVRVVRAATTNIEELLRRAQAWRGERRLGVLFWRLPSGAERLSMTASNVADALAPEPARPALDVLIERSESRRETWVLSVTLDNRNDEATDLAFFDSNYVDLAVRGGRIADVDPGDFARFELSRDGERATMRALREADKVRLFAPLVEGKQKLVSGPIAFVRGEGKPAILSSGRFILTDGEMLDLELREWSFGGDVKPARSAGALVPLLATTLWVACASSTRPPAGAGGEAVEANASSGFAQRVEGLEPRRGLIDLYPDAEHGKLLAAFPPPSGSGGEIGEYLYSEALRTGLGSNPVGLDRGQLGGAWRIRIRRLGGRVLIEAPNLRFRALAGDEPESAAVRESFATSVIWAGEILASDPSGRLLVDLTGFAVRDAHDVSRRLASAGQGTFSLDGARSVIDLDACRSFERNVELESLLTFSGSAPGDEVRAVAPDPRAVSLVLRQTIAQVPPPGYRPRPLDLRMGFWGVGFADYASALDEPVERAWTARHRLLRRDPGTAGPSGVEPIVYYVERAAPEPVRSALVDGASWWARAFDAAGFEDGFRVELLPEGADPLDLRYNVVQWVHRATRGWSYGGAVVDPLTGEIVKGHVSLGSLRVRQDRLLFEGLLGARPATGPDPVALALARIRQLAAHEVGHTLGLAHNFAGSARGRASVMDYPAPRIRIAGDGGLDLSEAYAVGVGAWDVAAIRWAYSEPPDGTPEARYLESVVDETLARDLVFLSDSDARPLGSAHPLASLWDDGADPVSSLETAMRVRALALSRFGPGNLAPGQPLARLDEILATVYLHHRYQVDAAAKLVGGVDYRHALRGDGQPAARPVDAESQRRALEALLAALDPAVLDLPEPLLRQLAPRAPELGESPERFGSRTAPAFDSLGAAAIAADLVLRALLEPARAARLVDQHRRSPALPGLDELLERIRGRVFASPAEPDPRRAEIARVVQRVLVDRLLRLSADGGSAPWVRSRVDATLSDLLQDLDEEEADEIDGRAHSAALAAEIGRHLARPAETRTLAPAALPEPPGPPIGAGFLPDLAGCDFELPFG